MRSIEQNLLPEERIVFRTKKHLIVFVYPTLIALVAIWATPFMAGNEFLSKVKWVPSFIVLLFYAQVGLEYWCSDFAVTNKRVLMREGFFVRHANETRLSAISQVNIYQDLFGQMFNYGSIVINAFGADDFFSMVDKPEEFKRQVNRQLDSQLNNR